jgi:hypothetical protein
MMKRRTAQILVFLVLLWMAVANLPGQGRRGGGGGGGSPGGGQYRGGRDSQTFVDRDGDGIDDRFQARHQQNQLRKLAESLRGDMNAALHLPPDSDTRLIRKASDIPGLPKELQKELAEKFPVAAPAQYSIEDGRLLTIFFTWSQTGGSLIRWYLLQSGGQNLRLEGKLLQAGLGKADLPPDYSIPDTIQWQPEPSAN